MQCPRCGNEMADGAPCTRCGARVRHVRSGADPDFTVRRVRLETPPHLRQLAGGLPRLRRDAAEQQASGRSKAFGLAFGALGLLVVAFVLYLAFGGGSGDESPGGRSADAGAPGYGGTVPAPAAPPGFPETAVAPGAAPSLTALPPGVVEPPPGPDGAPLRVGVFPSPGGGAPITVLPIGRYGVAVPLPATPPAAPHGGGVAPAVPEIPDSVLRIAAVPSTPAAPAASCKPTPCAPDTTGWAVADRARELLDGDPALAACWAEEAVRQGRKFNVPAMIASGYFHLGLAFRRMDCRDNAHGAFLSALCEGRSTVRPSLLESYQMGCERTGEGCDAPCRDERYIVSAQGGAP